MSEAVEMQDAVALVRRLIDTRTFTKERLRESEVRLALDVLGRLGTDAPDPRHRLIAISLMGKAGEVSKPISLAIGPNLDRALRRELPAIEDWGNAEDRFYLAKAIKTSRATWIPEYAAVALAQAEINERLSRDEWAELAITRAETLTSALRTIAEALRGWLSQRPDTADLAYRKLVRICEGLTQTLLTADVPTGDAFGEAFVSLVSLARGRKGADTQRVREDAATSVLDLVIQTLRLRFDIVFDSNIYRVVGAVRGWWRPARPPETVESRADRIAHLAMQGLHVLARQGVRDNELRRALSAAMDPDRIDAVGRIVAATDISLEPRVSKWLSTGQDLHVSRPNEAIQALNEQETDELLGRLMLTVIHRDLSSETLASIADAIELFEPSQAAVLRKAEGRVSLMKQWVGALAEKRRLRTYGTRADVVRYDPALHETAETLQRLSDVRIATAGVMRSVEGQPSMIIIKATVQSL